jgi:hypothetical protein
MGGDGFKVGLPACRKMARLALKQVLADLNLPLMILNRHGSIQLKFLNGAARTEAAMNEGQNNKEFS